MACGLAAKSVLRNAWRCSDVVLPDVDAFCLVVGMTEQYRKLTDKAENRMRTRTAKEQLAETLRELHKPQDEAIPDSDDASMQGYWPQHEFQR
jgi:hypothetical protein